MNTNDFKRVQTLFSQIKIRSTLTPDDLEAALDEINHLCDNVDIIDRIVETRQFEDLQNLLYPESPQVLRKTLSIFSKIINSAKDVNISLIPSLCISISEILSSCNNAIVVEICLKFFVDVYKSGCHTFLSSSDQQILQKSIMTSIIWDNHSIVSNTLYILNMDKNEDLFLPNFLTTNICHLLSKLRTGSTREKLGILICKLLLKCWVSFESSSKVTLFIENKFDEVIVKILFQSQITISSTYYQICLKLLCKFFFYNFDKTKENFRTSFEIYGSILLSHQSDIFSFLLENLQRFNNNDISIYGIKLFYLILTVSKTVKNSLNNTNQESWLSFIQDFFKNNLNSPKIIYWSFKTISKLIILNSSLIQININNNDSSVDKQVIQVLYSIKTINPKSFCASCELLSVLAVYSEKMQNSFLESRIYGIIDIEMHKYDLELSEKGDVLNQIHLAAVNALRSLFLHNLSAKELFYNESEEYRRAKKYLMNPRYHKHAENSDGRVVATNILLLASLVDYIAIKYDVMQDQMFDLNIILSCKNCSNNEVVIEAVQELLIVLSGSESETEFLLNICSIEDWCQIAKKFSDIYMIQKNTLVFLQLNSSKIEKQRQTEILSSIAEMIYRVVIKFDNSLIIKAEACVLIQILMNQYPEFINICVDNHLDTFLFETINLDYNEELVMIALQGFFILTESNKVRVAILTKAVKEQNLLLLQFMISLGTNLSIEESNTCLLFALYHENEIVAYSLTLNLLNKDYKPNKHLIEECLVSDNTSVAALLLRRFNIHESDKGFIINWSNLKMKKFDITWTEKLSEKFAFEIDKNVLWLKKRVNQESKNRLLLRENYQINLISQIKLFRYPSTHTRVIEKNYEGYPNYTIKPMDKFDKSDESDLSRGSSLNFPISKNRDIMTRTLINNTSSERYQRISQKTKLNNEKGYTYIPLPGEISEFSLEFRCGTDYSYHPLDPRCFLKDHERCSVDIQIPHLLREPTFDRFVKVSTGKESRTSLTSSILTSESLPKSDSLSSENQDQLTQIDTLNLSKNCLENVDDFLKLNQNNKLSKIFCNITSLRLDKNKLRKIDENCFQEMKCLQILDLSSNYLMEMPWGIFKFCPLNTLNISDNQINVFCLSDNDKEIVQSYGKAQHLINLGLSNNEFTKFNVKSLSIFQSLQNLFINRMSLDITSDGSLPLVSLRNLHMESNSISFINDTFLKSSKDIVSINMSKNLLFAVKNTLSINFALFENLVSLNLSHNNLACEKPFFIPMCILKMTNLQVIDMSYNKITELPSCSLWASSNLTEMNFANNFIQNLDFLNAKIKFQNLQNLDISHNLIKKIPVEIGDLTKLSSLNISFNPHLKSLPNEIGLLKKLNSLIRTNTPLNLPSNFNENSQLREIRKYYFNRLKNAVEYRNLKLMILGFNGRGKMALLRSLQGSKSSFIRTPNDEVTISSWRLGNKQSEYKFTCWNVPDQEELMSSHECLISKRALYILVFDVTKGNEEICILKPWLWNLKSQAPHAPLIVVGTHLDKLKENERANICDVMKTKILSLSRTSGLTKISDVVFVDARTLNSTVDKLKSTILNVLNSYKIRNEYSIIEKQPISYLKLEEMFQEVLKTLSPEYPILTDREIKDLVLKHKLDLDNDELNQAVQFLHESGVLIHLNDNLESSNNITILRPEWLYHIITKLIKMKKIQPFMVNGVVKLSDFKSICKGDFKASLSKYVVAEVYLNTCMKIFEKYNVVFQQSENEIIIPSKLPNSPKINISWNKSVPKINRVYEFVYLPTGFWSRLITKLSVLVKSFDFIFNNCKLQLTLWKTGLVVSLEETKHLVLEGKHEEEKEIINITVTESELWLKILVKIIDCIDVLIEEWYPGLIDEDIRGRSVLDCYCICPNCESKVTLMDITKKSMESDNYTCESCKLILGRTQNILIRKIAPDIVLGDLPEDLIIKPNLLKIDKSQENNIGCGGNGKVYKGTYKDEECAVKYIHIMDHTNGRTSYRQLRQEIEVLMQCQHHSLISLLAVDRERIVLEFAPLLDLKHVLSKYILSRILSQRIAYQIISGIQFLHANCIIYRDIKMQNVLVFSLELSSNINIKLADYGISRQVAPFGFIIPQGTPGYQAPEVLKKYCSYKLPADIYSFGILLFNLATRGHHPSDFQTSWRAGRPSEVISTERFEDWPRMQECICQCTKFDAEERPCAKDIVNFISCPTFVSIIRDWPLTKQTRIQCMIPLTNDENKVEIFLANGNSIKQEIRSLDIVSGKSKGRVFNSEIKRNKILCMFAYEDVILLGTHAGEISVFNYVQDTSQNLSRPFEDSILNIIILRKRENLKVLMLGLANGAIMYKTNFDLELVLNPNDFNKISLTEAPVINLKLLNNEIFSTCGSKIFRILFNENKNEFDHLLVLELDSYNPERYIKCFFPFTENINNTSITTFYFTVKDESCIFNYDDQGMQLKLAIDCEEFVEKKCKVFERNVVNKIMCFTVWSDGRYLAAGMSSGHLVLIDQTLNYSQVLPLFRYQILCIEHLKIPNMISKPKGNESPNLVKSNPLATRGSFMVHDNFTRYPYQNSGLVIGGNGYKSMDERDCKGASLIVISDDILTVGKELDEHIISRKNLI